MNNEQLNSFMKELQELEKDAGILSSLAPKLTSWASEATNIFKSQGFKEGLNFLEKYKSPTFHKFQNGTMSIGNELKNTGWLQKGVGDSIAALKNVSAGISENNTLGQNAKKFGRNVITMANSGYRSAVHTTKDLSTSDATNSGIKGVISNLFGKPQVIVKDGKQYFKGKLGLPDRPILGTSKDGTKGIVKKRALAQVGALAATPVGFGAQAALFPSKETDNKETSNSDDAINRAQTGLKQTALWTFARPFGEIGIGLELAKSFKKKNNEQQI